MTAALDFAMLPPEVNSARMYSGEGSGPMLTAASAWNALAAELHSTALSYGRVLAALTGEEWHGPFDDYNAAKTEWSRRSWSTVDDAMCRYRIEKLVKGEHPQTQGRPTEKRPAKAAGSRR